MLTGRRRGIIDSLSAGFGIVTRRPWLIVLPVAVDALLWLIPGISVKPLLKTATAWLTGTLVQAPLSPDQLVDVKTQVEEVSRLLESLNVLGVLGWQLPSLLGISGMGEGAQVLWSVHTWGSLFLMLAGLAATAVLLACCYLAPIAQLVRYNQLNPGLFLRRLGSNWAHLAAYLLLLILGGMALLGILLLFTGLLGLFGPGALALGSGLALGLALLLAVYLFLADDAIFVAGSGPIQAIRQSVRIASQGFWPLLGLFLLVNVITQGMGAIWGRLADTGIGLLVAVVGNAYIATGLVSAVMVYFWDRYSLAQQPRVPAS